MDEKKLEDFEGIHWRFTKISKGSDENYRY
jgi:hypothetical protein